MASTMQTSVTCTISLSSVHQQFALSFSLFRYNSNPCCTLWSLTNCIMCYLISLLNSGIILALQDRSDHSQTNCFLRFDSWRCHSLESICKILSQSQSQNVFIPTRTLYITIIDRNNTCHQYSVNAENGLEPKGRNPARYG